MKSQNGWNVATKAQCDQGPFHGATFPNGILAGDVAAIARWQLDRYAATVEPIHPGQCWGWYVKKIEGSDTVSNHASGTAWDINAETHVMGAAPSASFTPAQIAACRAIVAAAGGVLRWGGDYSGRKDGMHWEIIGSHAAAAAFAKSITRKVTMTKITTAWPALQQGDRDQLLPGYDNITRWQRITGATDDGIWGPATTAAIAKFCKIAESHATKMTETIFRQLLGLPEA